MNMIKVEENPSYARDSDGFILGIDDREYCLALHRLIKEQEEMSLYRRVNTLEEQNNIILQRLNQLISIIGEDKCLH